MNKVAIISNNSKYHDLLSKKALPELMITTSIADANIILADPPQLKNTLTHCSKLSWIQSTYAGIDAILNEVPNHVTLTNVKGIFGQPMSEYVFGQLLSLTRHQNEYKKNQNQQLWQSYSYQTLSDRRMVIIGTGTIGQEIAKVAKAFNMPVVGVNRSGIITRTGFDIDAYVNPYFDEILPFSELTQQLKPQDIIVSVLPSTLATRDIFDTSFFSSCLKSIFINVGRGDSLVEDALLTAIKKGQISHAILDVFKQEPLPEDHAFWHHPKITITPHIAAISSPEQVIEIFSRNYLKWCQHQPLDFVIDLKTGY
ncbi:D-2-hydroxyacid dehydrogenase [Vibrio sp. SS-MA-C1-2]|uniref:D-2-hydroxyacid dehydrogenase n=1 Tax=Vibrio sp. SS-MA-C1-2 TaxID=2908646 RepID=UPI001F2BF847|nr:D-2-hydroxyacid dehydrogenase [Vibrio sp. SS-MA-C1-2]UJF19178.1 D-2-hydroxyacid dehydrogenase [Vibrio sp. SS-MA-C1-2]